MVEKLDKARALQAATSVWNSLDANGRHGIRFGLFPAKAMKQAEVEFGMTEDGTPYRDFGRLLAIALMDIASKNGGMLA